MLHLIRPSIRNRLVLAFSALVGLISLFVLLLVTWQIERQSMAAARARVTAIREVAAYSLRAGLMFDDSTSVSEVLSNASHAPDVSFLAVWDATGRRVAMRGSRAPLHAPLPTAGATSMEGSTLVTAMVIHSDGVFVGSLAIGLSLEPVRTEVTRARRLGALIAIAIFIIGTGVILLLSTYITRPLIAVAATVNRIAAGDLSQRAQEPRDAEVRTLVRAFNRMIDKLAGTQSELASINAELEHRVEARTTELATLFDLAPQAIVATDTQGRVVRWNRASERLFGWRAAEVIGITAPFAGEWLAMRERADTDVDHRGSDPIAVLWQRKDGTALSVLAAVGRVSSTGPDLGGHIGVFSDLTERNRLEEQLRQSQKMEAMGQLAGGIAHDFNNILTIITACSELLLMNEELDPDDREQLEHIQGAATRASALTRQLLTFTRQQVVQMKIVDTGAIVRGFAPMLRRVLAANIKLEEVAPDEMGTIQADPSQLEQVVMNLVVNAADAMIDGGILHIELGRIILDEGDATRLNVVAGPYNRLIVRDTGTGMDAETLRRIFEPFFTTKGLGKGTGLGLATVYSIVSALKGGIRVNSAVGKGTTFELFFPEYAVIQQAKEVTGEIPCPSFFDGPATVLLVEDEEQVRRVVRRGLERDGFKVIEAPDGESALSQLANLADVNVVVTDMMMPGMSGHQLADRLRRFHPNLGVVFISGYTDPGPVGLPMLDTSHVFMNKPFTRAQLTAAVRSVLDANSILS